MPALIRIPSVLLLSLACAQALAAVPARAPVGRGHRGTGRWSR
ncbi:hypothetical protein ACE0DR_25900 [Azotobacter sp. CWF10]